MADSFDDGLARVKAGYNYGLIDKTSKEIVLCIYFDMASFSDGLARVENKDSEKYGYYYIDKTGKEITGYRCDRQRN